MSVQGTCYTNNNGALSMKACVEMESKSSPRERGGDVKHRGDVAGSEGFFFVFL